MGRRRAGALLDPLTRAARAALDPVLAVVLAPVCVSCNALLDRPTGGPVCDRCWHSIRPFTPPVCDRCGDPLPGLESTVCPDCGRTRRAVDRARAIGAYDGVLRALVHALKYDGRRSLAPRLAGLMRDRGAELLEGAAAVVPVPLHRWRRLARGFNQAADLARHLGPPLVPALRRVRATPTQTGLTAAPRRQNVRGAFAATRASARLRGGTVVLVDDVCTTGATLEACARALRHAGVREVRALTAGRVAAGPR